MGILETKSEPNKRDLKSVARRDERGKFEAPVGWLLGRQLLGSLKGILLYTAYGQKLDPRDWMSARVFPSRDKAEALKFWRQRFERGPIDAQTPADHEEFRRGKKEFWFDYISDTGDGMKATYSIAYLCLGDLYVKSRDPQRLVAGEPVKTCRAKEDVSDYEVLPRGEFLFIGGDTAYHVSDYMTLANRVQRPFQWAYEDLLDDGGVSEEAPNRPLVGIPGNHDYYDQLDGFRRQFRRPVRSEPPRGPLQDPPTEEDTTSRPQLFMPGFNRLQEASYVALHLPFDWWLWGLDTEVGQVDERQQKFFHDLYEQDPADPRVIIPPRKLIVATCAPTTVFGKLADPKNKKAAGAFGQLGLAQPFLPDEGAQDLSSTGDAKMKAGQCRLDISGDVHHYARYWGPPTGGARRARAARRGRAARRAGAQREAPSAASYASVVSGIGGAFHHPSATYLGEAPEQALYPSEKKSTGAVAQRIFKFWNIWRGGNVWLAGFIVAFTIYFASLAPQSSRQVINNFPLIEWLHLAAEPPEPISPLVAPLPHKSTYSDPVAKALTDAANEPITTFWGRTVKLLPSCDRQLQIERNPHLYFYGPCRVRWTWDLIIGVALSLASLAPLLAGLLSKRLFENARERAPGADAKPSQKRQTAYGTQSRPMTIDPEIHAEPDSRLWLLVVVSALMFFLGLAMIKPYRAHLTPFGGSMTIQWVIIWAVVAIALSFRYSEFLFKKAHRAYVHKYDWALTWALTVLSLAGVTLGLWWFGGNNLPALLVSDMVFMFALAGSFLMVILLPFLAGAELLCPHGKVVKGVGKLLIGLWHAALQISVPFILVR
ncbi:MAG TPA: hypothetical protein VG324_03055, partial [Blastocatellia bacterium]|nr:hypothetical protein [Blastocatellia bacterium]